jgi:putative peptidoglycan lipid II flippase
VSLETVRNMPGKNIIRSAAVVSLCTGMTRIFGFVREILMAHFFGTTLAKSAFDIAFKIPNLFRRLFGEGALSSAFVPVFTETLEHAGKDAAWMLAGRIATMMATILFAIVAVGVVAIEVSLRWFDLGERLLSVLPLLKIMLPYVFFICLVALCMAIMNSFHRFVLPAITPILLNIIWIIVILFLLPYFGETPAEQIRGVAWGVLFAGVLQFAVQFPALIRYGFRFRFSFDWHTKRVRKILGLMLPAALGLGVLQFNVVIDGILALWIGKWAPAALTYAERLIYLPLGVFATALGTVLLPAYSRQATRAEPEEIRKMFKKSFRILMFIMVPASVGLMVLARPIVQAMYMRGMFGEDSVLQTTRALVFYASGLAVFGFYKIVVPAFYALQDTRTPVRVALWMVGLNLTLNILFIATWPYDYKHAGLAFATVISSLVNCVVLSVLLSRRIKLQGWGGMFASLGRILIASLVMAGVAFGAESVVATAVGGARLTGKVVQVASMLSGIAAGMTTYAICSWLICRPEFRELVGSLRRRTTEPVTPA